MLQTKRVSFSSLARAGNIALEGVTARISLLFRSNIDLHQRLPLTVRLLLAIGARGGISAAVVIRDHRCVDSVELNGSVLICVEEYAMLVKEAMSMHVESVAPNTTARECARKMRQAEIGVLAVRENDKLIGVVTDRDICCRALGEDRDVTTTTAREVMTSEVSSCFEDQDCTEAARLMKEKRVRRLAVLDRNHNLVGLLSVDDLARCSHKLAGEILKAAAPWPH